MTLKRVWMVLLAIPLLGHAAALDVVRPAAPGQEKIVLKEYLSVLEDPTGKLAFPDVLSGQYDSQFRSGFSSDDFMNYGFTKSAFWVRLDVRNSGSAPVRKMLELESTTLSSVSFYSPDAAGQYQTIQTGLDKPFTSRAYPNRYFVFPLELPAGTDKTLYLRVQSSTHVSLVFNLWEPAAFHLHERNEYGIQAILIGITLALLIYNTLIWLILRIHIYLYYIVYSVLTSLSLFAITGVLGEWIPTVAVSWVDHAYDTLFPIATACLAQFQRLVLDMEKHLPRQNRVMHAWSAFYLFVAFLYTFWQPYLSLFYLALSYAVAVSFISCIIVYMFAKGIAVSKQILFGCIFLGTGYAPMLLGYVGLLPVIGLTHTSFQVGVAMEMMVLAVALASRFDAIRKESARVQAEALRIEKLRVEQLQSSERVLEERVSARTEALVSTQHQLEAAKEVAEEAARAKSDFLAVMSHEIRTPLNSIVGMAYLMQNTPSDQKARSYAAKINGAAENLQVILNDVLDFSKLEANKLSLEESSFALAEVLDQVRDLFADRAATNGVGLTFEVSPELPPVLVGDSVRLGQILANLTGNALKFTRAGVVVIGVEPVEQKEGRQELRFWVRDTGIGISAEQCERLFLPFSQADATVTRKFGGTGLGLAICKRLVDLMGGQIGVQSELGVGSTFSFQVAFGVDDGVHAPLARPAPALPQSADTAGLRVLLVEDNLLNIEMASDLLHEAGMLVDVAHDGNEALSLLNQKPFDIVLMDCQMPNMDGYSATQEIRRNPQWDRLPVIAMTANLSAETLARAKSVGMNDVIPKPINPQNVLLTIASWAPARGADLQRQPEN